MAFVDQSPQQVFLYFTLVVEQGERSREKVVCGSVWCIDLDPTNQCNLAIRWEITRKAFLE